MSKNDNSIESLNTGGLIGAVFGAFLSKDKEDGVVFGLFLGKLFLLLLMPIQRYKKLIRP